MAIEPDNPDDDQESVDDNQEPLSAESAGEDPGDDANDGNEQEDGNSAEDVNVDSTNSAETVMGTGPTRYDFNHPQHRLGDPIPQLDICGSRLAAGLTEALDVRLHVDVTVEIVESRYQKHSDFIDTLRDTSCLFRSDVSPFSLDVLISLDRDLIVELVNLLFGGSSETSQPTSSRTLSETEKRFAFRLRREIIEVLSTVCKDCFTLTNHEEEILSKREIATASVENAVLAVQEYKIQTKDQQLSFCIVYPWTAVDSLSLLLADELPDQDDRKKQWKTKLREHVAESSVELRGRLAETEVTVSQLLEMKSGDFIPLGEVGPAAFFIDNTPVFSASVGAANGFISANILEWTIQGDSRNG